MNVPEKKFVGAPVVLHAGARDAVEHALEDWVRHRPDELECRCERPRRRQISLGLPSLARVTPHNPTHVLELQLLRERIARRHDQESEQTRQVVGCLRQHVLPHAHHVRGALERPQHRPRDDGVDRVQPERERRHDAEVAAATTKRPEEIGILVRVCGHERPVGEDDVG
jgi:hypothetical protein